MAKRLKFIKAHWRHRIGEVALLDDAAADYFLKCNVAIEVKADAPEVKISAPKKTRKSKKK